MKGLLPSLLLLLSTAGLSTAEQIEIRHVSELIKPSDAIARVTIISVRETGAQEGYTKIAYASVTDAVTGVEVGGILELENDAANVICPNVRYAEGEDVLVFAKKLPNGHYETTYADAGKFLIEGEAVGKQPFKTGQSYRSARAEIRRELRKTVKAQDRPAGRT